jgi:hypothetical protein
MCKNKNLNALKNVFLFHLLHEFDERSPVVFGLDDVRVLEVVARLASVLAHVIASSSDLLQ